ncbi:helix-turn-helix domain-containing protein [Leadbettera azotonutricia]|uniref:Transcriptional regulator, LuxR family protein n=1 Tax=Leadbettera azotonutricia (strain ATCC BAA-888 / DSM 13862 / ZAS-9) TaxID=545695 RepID=F5YFJ3_LEAAZ|nr:helix-turn-helix transcriptional regulator [Leadbettera azotonutricia]AEF81082.1 transcriptional regulator, LuxR family protein [Leadbettera azotonutricia ZAS-9]
MSVFKKLPKNVVRIKNIRPHVLVYVLMWILYYAWALVFVTAHLPIIGFFNSDLRAFVHWGILFSAALYLCFYKKTWFVKTARIGSIAALIIFLILIYVVPANWLLPLALVLGFILGLVNDSILIPFVYIMNNTEKFYAVLCSNILIILLGLAGKIGLMQIIGERQAALVFLILAFLPVLFFKKADLDAEESTVPPPRPKKITYFSLTINFAFALAVLGFGKFMLDRQDSYIWAFSGGLLGCGIYIIIFAFIRKSLNLAWNICFASFFLGILFAVLDQGFNSGGNTAAFIPAASFLIGLAGTVGMINMFYNIGVIGRKYNNMNHLRITLWFGFAGGGICILISRWFNALAGGAPALLILVLSAVMVFFYFIISPILTRTYFEDDWVDDMESSEIDGDKVLAFNQYKLTKREIEVCRMLLEGYTMRQIGAYLHIAQPTVNTHCTAIYRKTGVTTRWQLGKLFKNL